MYSKLETQVNSVSFPAGLSSPPELEFRATVGTAISSGGHHWNGDQQWLPPSIAIPVVAFFLPLICIHKQTKKLGQPLQE